MLISRAVSAATGETRTLTRVHADHHHQNQAESHQPCQSVGDCNPSPIVPEVCPPRKQRFIWYVERTAAPNYRALGKCLNSARGDLYRHHSDGHELVEVLPDGTARRIDKGSKLAPVIVDRVRMLVVKEDKVVSELPATTHLNAMLRSEEFLKQFLPLDEVVTEEFYLEDFSLAKPGYTDAGVGQRILFLGQVPEIIDSTATIEQFLDIMAFETNADRTNAVAAALTLKFRRHWPGQKPVTVVTASKSHSGKGTVTDFIQGSTPKADILYQEKDWPMQSQFQRQLRLNPQVGLVLFDNVRCDSAGRATSIRSGFIESFITTHEVVLAAPGAGEPLRIVNRFVVAINTNDGRLSTDLMNRALCVHLAPKGSVLDRPCPLGNPKLDYLPKHQARIKAELHGMIAKWNNAGRPLDYDVKHSMLPWARVIGGILKVSGFTDFLANSTTRKSVDDPIREALAILGAAYPDRKLRPRDWAKTSVTLGVARTLLPPNERGTLKGRERSIGVVLKRHCDETFTAQTDSKTLRLRLQGGLRRWRKGKNPHVRYFFQVLEVTASPTDDEVSLAAESLNRNGQ